VAPAPVLLVEDSAIDVELTRIAFEDAGLVNELVVVGDGTDALAYLRGEPPFEQRVAPELVLLDLHLPKLDGPEVIRELAADPGIDPPPIVALADPHDADLATIEDHCIGALAKPVDVERLTRLVRATGSFEVSARNGELAIVRRSELSP
jgi:CheY-like chemotaxis protein